MSNQIITPLEAGNISVGDDIRIYVPSVQDESGVPLEYALMERGRVTRVDVDHDGVQATVKLDSDPPDTDEEVFAGYLIGGGNGNLIAVRVSIEGSRFKDMPGDPLVNRRDRARRSGLAVEDPDEEQSGK